MFVKLGISLEVSASDFIFSFCFSDIQVFWPQGLQRTDQMLDIAFAFHRLGSLGPCFSVAKMHT